MIRRAGTTLSEGIADNLARQIEEGILPAGSKLPSIREYADASGCSKNTV
ncbi:GntR family transcriptional regulator, partial [Burkholderia cepacia]